MTFQTSVANDMAWGIPGEQALAGDVRAEPVQLKTAFSGTPGQNSPFGAVALTQASGENGAVSIGGDGVFIGILSSPKQWTNYSVLGGNVINIEEGARLEAVSQSPGMWIALTTDAAVGDAIAYKADGTLVSAPASTAPASSTLITGSRIVRYNVNTGAAIVSLQQLPVPAPAAETP